VKYHRKNDMLPESTILSRLELTTWVHRCFSFLPTWAPVEIPSHSSLAPT
jgi:hypothetical protein